MRHFYNFQLSTAGGLYIVGEHILLSNIHVVEHTKEKCLRVALTSWHAIEIGTTICRHKALEYKRNHHNYNNIPAKINFDDIMTKKKDKIHHTDIYSIATRTEEVHSRWCGGCGGISSCCMYKYRLYDGHTKHKEQNMA